MLTLKMMAHLTLQEMYYDECAGGSSAPPHANFLA